MGRKEPSSCSSCAACRAVGMGCRRRHSSLAAAGAPVACDHSHFAFAGWPCTLHAPLGTMRLGAVLLLAVAVGIGTLLQRAQPPAAPQFVPVADGVYRCGGAGGPPPPASGSTMESPPPSLPSFLLLEPPLSNCPHHALHGSTMRDSTSLPTAPWRRLTQVWRLLPGVPFLPVAVGLMRAGPGAWVLVDTGFRNGPHHNTHASHLLAALRAAIPPGQRLAAIARACCEFKSWARRAQLLWLERACSANAASPKTSPRPPLRPPCSVHSGPPPPTPRLFPHPAVTHGHLDHSGGLPLLLEAYPDVPVLAHANEAPFLQGAAAQYMSPAWRAAYGALGMDHPQPLKVRGTGAACWLHRRTRVAAARASRHELFFPTCKVRWHGGITIVHPPLAPLAAGPLQPPAAAGGAGR